MVSFEVYPRIIVFNNAQKCLYRIKACDIFHILLSKRIYTTCTAFKKTAKAIMIVSQRRSLESLIYCDIILDVCYIFVRNNENNKICDFHQTQKPFFWEENLLMFSKFSVVYTV